MQSHDDEDYTNCIVCFELFDLDNARPLFLECRHTFCFKCLKDLQKKERVQCPLCRAYTVIEDVSLLPRNRFTEQIVFMHHQREMEKDTWQMQWCFTCVSAGSLSCVKEDHAIFNMSTSAENLNANISISSFQKDIEKWKSVNEDLKEIFLTKPAFSEEIFALMDNADAKLDILSGQLNRLSFDHEREQNRRLKIQKHFERQNVVLSESKARRMEIRNRILEIRQEEQGSQEEKEA